jgi:hypothetical protein
MLASWVEDTKSKKLQKPQAEVHPHHVSNQRGQIMVEVVLLAVIFVAIAMAVSEKFKKSAVLSNLVEGPWAYIDGMAQHGYWGPARVARAHDPNFAPRRSSKAPERTE